MRMIRNFVVFAPTENIWLLCRSFPKEKQKSLLLCSQAIEAAYSTRRGFSFSRTGLRIRETGYCRCYGSRRRNGKTFFVIGKARLSSCYSSLFRKFPPVPARLSFFSAISCHITTCDDTFRGCVIL